MRVYSLALGFIVSAGVSTSAQALETMSRDELLAMCRSGSAEQVAVCTGYINGFLDGAFATDPNVVESVVGEIGKEESFSERAIRTRLGLSLERFGPSYYAGFCIPGDMPMDTILAELHEAAKQESNDTGRQNARDYLYRLLQAQHPCTGEDGS